MTHSEMDELYELYLMGVLESDQAAEISEHLQRNCAHCETQIRDSSVILETLAGSVELAAPPPQLRDRVLSLAGNRHKSSRWPVAFALASAAALAFVFWGATERRQFVNAQTRMQEVTRQRNELRAAVAILSEGDIRTVKFGESQADPHGRVFVSHNGGVVFVGSRLPQLATGKTFELWLVPVKGKPQAAGLFRTNADGVSVNVLAQTFNPSDFAAVAVSIEPDRGSPQPSAKPILVVPLA